MKRKKRTLKDFMGGRKVSKLGAIKSLGFNSVGEYEKWKKDILNGIDEFGDKIKEEMKRKYPRKKPDV